MDVAFRRAVLTGVNQTCAEIQLENMNQMGTDLVETTAHNGARPDHAVWQGRVFSVGGKNPKYPDFEIETGYGEGGGLCGWNCRHSFFPFIEGLSDPAYTADKLREYNNKTVEFNGEKMSLYAATQQQRYIERQIRRWKREESAMDAAGQDSGYARMKVREWQAAQRDFVGQTGLTRDYFRERGGGQLGVFNPEAGGIIKVGDKHVVGILPKGMKYAASKANIHGFEDNCQRCVPAYELLRQGFKVTAKAKPINNTIHRADDVFDATYKYAYTQGYGSSARNVGFTKAALEAELKTYPDGSRFAVGCNWSPRQGGGSHAFVAEKIKGEIVYVDPQSGIIGYTGFEQARANTLRYFQMNNVKIKRGVDLGDIVEAIKK